MGRKSLAKERRVEIAHGLYRCIAKQGYANTTVRDIARETDIALGVLGMRMGVGPQQHIEIIYKTLKFYVK